MNDGGQIAEAFVSARREARGLPEYPGVLPGSLSDAYAIQERAIRLTGGAVAGWKVGKIPPPLDTQFGSNRLAGPIFAHRVFEKSDGIAMPIFADGFGAAEAEFLLRIGTLPDPAKTSFTLEEAAELIDAVHVGIEIASSPFPGINQHGPAVTISDFGNNHGLIVGEEISQWRDGAFIDWPVQLLIDGAVAGDATARDMLDGPIGAAAFLFELAATQGIVLEAGQWISSGAVTGVHEVRVGQSVVARFNTDILVSCSIEAAIAEDVDGVTHGSRS